MHYSLGMLCLLPILLNHLTVVTHDDSLPVDTVCLPPLFLFFYDK